MKPPYSTSPLQSAESFQSALVAWFRENAASYAWRETIDPYEILVSEVMLQQTTVQAVVENKRYESFLSLFPDVETLATASEEEILRAWEGLGYYNRVRNLQKTARAVYEEHEGIFPDSLAGLKELPGIGPYTAAAVASFSYNAPAPLVDANVLRVFSRLFNDATPIDSPAGQREAWERAEVLVSQSDARSYNAALMELGQKVCKNKEALCSACPVAEYCLTKDPLLLPMKKPKQKAIEVTEHTLCVIKENGDLLLEKGDESRRKGMWTLPKLTEEQAMRSSLIHQSKYAITKYKVTLMVYSNEGASLDLKPNQKWVPRTALTNLPMPSPIRRVINELSELR